MRDPEGREEDRRALGIIDVARQRRVGVVEHVIGRHRIEADRDLAERLALEEPIGFTHDDAVVAVEWVGARRPGQSWFHWLDAWPAEPDLEHVAGRPVLVDLGLADEAEARLLDGVGADVGIGLAPRRPTAKTASLIQPETVTLTLRLPLRAVVASSSAMRSSRSAQQSSPRIRARRRRRAGKQHRHGQDRGQADVICTLSRSIVRRRPVPFRRALHPIREIWPCAQKELESPQLSPADSPRHHVAREMRHALPPARCATTITSFARTRIKKAAEMSPASRQLTAILYGIACHACFVAGVGAMVVMMYYGMSLSLGRLEPPWRWIANGALLLQFPLTHSLLLTDRGRGAARAPGPRRPRPRSRSTTTYVIIASISVFALFALWSPTGIIWWQAHGPLLVLMTGLYAAAWLLLAKAMADAGLALQTGQLGWWAVLNDRKPVYPGMPEAGLFRYSRQPIYVAFALTLWTTPTWTPDQLVVAHHADALLRRRAAPQGGPLSARLWPEVRRSTRRRVPYWLPWPRPPSAGAGDK